MAGASSITINNEIYTLTDQSGYFRLGPKTIIVPEQTSIHQNYPNPFNPNTTIRYDVGLLDGLRQNVTINVYNLVGQNIATLVKDQDQIGQFKVQWDGFDKHGQQMASGIYFVQLTTKTGIVKNKKDDVTKMMFIKYTITLFFGIIYLIQISACRGDVEANDADLSSYGWVLYESGDYVEALDWFTTAIKEDSSHSDAYNGVGWTMGHLRQQDSLSIILTSTLIEIQHPLKIGWTFMQD